MARWDSKRAALFAPTHGIPRAWGIKPHGGTGPAAAEGRDVSPPAGGWHGVAGGMPAPIAVLLPSHRCFSGLDHWPGWRSSGTRRPAGTSPFSRQRAGASWHGSTSRRERFVPATLPSPLCCTISPKMGSAAFLRLLGQHLLLPPSPEPWGARRNRGARGNRQGGCWASPRKDEATLQLLLLSLEEV